MMIYYSINLIKMNFKSILFKGKYYPITFKLNFILGCDLQISHKMKYVIESTTLCDVLKLSDSTQFTLYSKFLFDKIKARNDKLLACYYFNKLHRDPKLNIEEEYISEDDNSDNDSDNDDNSYDKPAYMEFHKNRNTKLMAYYQHGELHRDRYPAVYEYSYCGSRRSKKYYQNGELHRDGKPALIEYDEYSNFREYESYYQHGKLHNECGPAFIHNDGRDEVEREEYYINGELHNEHGPAIIEYDTIWGHVYTKEYYQHGELHRVGKPAIKRYEDGKLIEVEYYENGIEM